MRKLLLVGLVAAACLALAGCAPQVLNTTPTKSYQVGQRIQAAPGGTLLSSQEGTLKTVRRWVGILNSPDGWETSTARDSSFVRKELLYSGLSGSTIEISYREFRGNLAAPAFYQSAKYDLAASKEISFQNFRFRVDSADNNGMTGVLLSDGLTTASNPPPASGQKTGPSGKDTLQAQAVARAQACAAQPVAALTAAGPGFETYSVSCTNGDALAIRCEFGNCRVLR